MMQSSVKDFLHIISCFVIEETQAFQLTRSNRIENVNCELLRGLAKENLPEILERKNVQAHGRGNNCTSVKSSWQGSRHYTEQRSE